MVVLVLATVTERSQWYDLREERKILISGLFEVVGLQSTNVDSVTHNGPLESVTPTTGDGPRVSTQPSSTLF